MHDATAGLLVLMTVTVVVATVVSMIAVRRFKREGRAATGRVPPAERVSVLKPLCGADDRLEANLEGFFVQQGVDFELIFGVEGQGDPAVAVVRRLRARYPEVRATLVIHDGGRGLNPKVSNLRAMVGAATGDIVVVSDSNVAVGPSWLAGMAADFAVGEDVGMVTNLFVGTGEVSLGAAFENLHLAGPVAGSIAATHVFGRHVEAVGKSMMFRLSVFERLGGWESVATVLAEDFVMGRMFVEAGLDVKLATATVSNVSVCTSMAAFLKRHLRWGLIRSRVMPQVYVLEPLFNTMLPVVLGVAAGGVFGAVLAGIGLVLTVVRDAGQWLALRGAGGLGRVLPLGPVKELLMLGVWVAAPFLGRVSWRGRRYRVSVGTRLYAGQMMEPPRAWSQE